MPLLLITSTEWNALVAMVEDTNATVHKIDQNMQRMMTAERIMAQTLDDVLADIADLGSKEDGLVTLTKALQAQVNQITSGSLSPEQQAKVDQVFAAVEARKQAIQAALDEGTPPSPLVDPGNPSQAPTGDQPQVNPESRKR